MSKALGLLVEGILYSTIIVGFASLGWNQLGVADALSLPHIGFWVIYGFSLVLSAAATTVGGGMESGRIRARDIAERSR